MVASVVGAIGRAFAPWDHASSPSGWRFALAVHTLSWLQIHAPLPTWNFAHTASVARLQQQQQQGEEEEEEEREEEGRVGGEGGGGQDWRDGQEGLVWLSLVLPPSHLLGRKELSRALQTSVSVKSAKRKDTPGLKSAPLKKKKKKKEKTTAAAAKDTEEDQDKMRLEEE